MMVKSTVMMMIMSSHYDDNDDGLPFKTSGPDGHSNNEQSGPRRPKSHTTFNERQIQSQSQRGAFNIGITLNVRQYRHNGNKKHQFIRNNT